VEIRLEARERKRDTDGGKEEKVPERRKKKREGEMEFSQGLMRKSKKLQRPLCKVKIPINLKP
jgi:hypothetical protein